MNNTVIYPRRIETRKEPRNLNERDIELFKHEFTIDLRPVTLVEFQSVYILRNLIFSLRLRKFYLSFTNVFDVSKKYMFKRLLMFFRPTQEIKSGIWVTDELSSEYFHWFTDSLTRLIAIDSILYKSDSKAEQSKHPIILPIAYKQKAYIESSLVNLGYKTIYYNPKKSVHVQQLITCGHTAPMGNYNSSLVKYLRDAFLKQPNEATIDRKIYISRSKAFKRKIVNEDAVVELMLADQYEIHNFEDYSLIQQVQIMHSVKTIVSLHGAGLTNMLFMPAGGNVLELRNEGDAHNNCYFSLASSLDQKYYYLNNKGDRADTNSVNITVDLEGLKAVLELMK